MIDKLINNNFDKLNSEDMKLLLFIKTNISEIINISIDDFARISNFPKDKIYKTLNKIGISSIQELQKIISLESSEKEIDIEKMYFNINDTIRDLRARKDDKLLEDLIKSKRIFLYGTGHIQNIVCLEFIRSFMYLDIHIIHIEGEEQRKIVEEIIDENDMLIVISLSGENAQAIELVKKVSDRAKVLSITEKGINTLSRKSDYSLHYSTENLYINEYGVTIAPLNQMYLLVDYLFIKLYDYKTYKLDKN